MAPTAGLTLGAGLTVVGICLIDFYRRRLSGKHGV